MNIKEFCKTFLSTNIKLKIICTYITVCVFTFNVQSFQLKILRFFCFECNYSHKFCVSNIFIEHPCVSIGSQYLYTLLKLLFIYLFLVYSILLVLVLCYSLFYSKKHHFLVVVSDAFFFPSSKVLCAQLFFLLRQISFFIYSNKNRMVFSNTKQKKMKWNEIKKWTFFLWILK